MNWNRRSTFLITGLLIDAILFILLTVIFNNKIPWQQVGTAWGVIPISIFTLELILGAILMQIFPSFKKWWFSMEI